MRKEEIRTIALDVYMIDELENDGRLMRIAKKPEEVGTRLYVKETWAKENGVLYYKQYCDKHNLGQKRWCYANAMPESFARYQVEIASCTETTEAAFYAKYGRCLRYNKSLWSYDGINNHDSEWFRERQWQDISAATSSKKIFVIEYNLMSYSKGD